jgi:hypothetical protein
MAKHKPVNKDLAQDCVNLFKKMHQASTDHAVQKSYSEGIVFDKAELIAWLNTIQAPSVKIAFGIYTDAFVQKYPEAKQGRLTTFIVPTQTIPHAAKGPIITFALLADGGTPPPLPTGDEDPFNQGELLP